MEALGGQRTEPPSFVTLPPVCGRSLAPRLRGTAVLTAGLVPPRGSRGFLRAGPAVTFSWRVPSETATVAGIEAETRGSVRR